jgi:hypothetical protein
VELYSTPPSSLHGMHRDSFHFHLLLAVFNKSHVEFITRVLLKQKLAHIKQYFDWSFCVALKQGF